MGRALVLSCVLLGLGAAGLGGWLLQEGPEIRLSIPSGLSASETGALLKRAGVLRSTTVFKLLAKLGGRDRSLKPGEYLLRKPMPAHKVLRALHAGDVEQVKVVIPEGFMAKQIADRLQAEGVTGADAFMRYVRQNNLEGFLFPTTYFFAKGLAAESVAHSMHAEHKKRLEPILAARPPGGFSSIQVVTLASIVQREAGVVEEMPMIAGVYLNRLKVRMPLEADPTVQYALGRDTGKWLPGLRYKHLETRSKYNTYMYNGLPPGPICSPGEAALLASLAPAKTEALFFVADNSGRHIFSRTLEEHNRARQRVKAGQNSRRR